MVKLALVLTILRWAIQKNVSALAAFGFCNKCERIHTVPTTEAARKHACILRDRLQSTGRLDFDSTQEGETTGAVNPLLEVSRLNEHRGKMFGVLIAKDSLGNEVVLKAFAGKIRSYGWKLDGWVDPIAVPEEIPRFVELRDHVSRVCHRMEQCEQVADGSSESDAKKYQTSNEWNDLKDLRVGLSREALDVLRNEQRVVNFYGEMSTVADAFLTVGKMPVGTGECCATKLVAAASKRGLRPTGIAEFFLGNSDRRRVQNSIFYDACQDRCQKVLGFMLCGLDES